MKKPTKKQLDTIEWIEEYLTSGIKFVGLSRQEAGIFIRKYRPQASRERSARRVEEYMDNNWSFEDDW